MSPAILAEGVEKRYGETVALADVSLAVDAGEAYGLVGPNGAGKTTLVRALTGTVEPDGGTVAVLDAEPRSASRDRIGVLPQAFSPPDRLTAREVLSYYAGLYDEPRDPETVLAEVGMADAADTWYENLSGGQQRRVCLGTALVNDPELLVLDEPTTGIDPAGRRTVWRTVETSIERGATVLLTTHDMREAERLSDRVGVLADGRLVAEGTPTELVGTHAGGPRVMIETESPPETVPALGGTATAADDGVVVSGVDAGELGALVAELDRAGIAYRGIEWRQPDLEDVYLSLVGEAERRRTDRGRLAEGSA